MYPKDIGDNDVKIIYNLRAAAPAADPGTHQGAGVLQLALGKKL